MKILAIETATEACSVALLINNTSDADATTNIISQFQLAPREHTKLILPMMDEVLNKANIDLKELNAIAFSRGPGAFTGLRIAAGVAQGVALSIDKPIIPVSTLESLALQAQLQNKIVDGVIIAALDARMGETYWGSFSVKNEEITLLGEERVTSPELMLEEAQSFSENAVIVTGIGWDAYQETLFEQGIPENIHYLKAQYPKAEYIVRLAKTLFEAGKAVDSEDAQPVYIRNKVAEKQVKHR